MQVDKKLSSTNGIAGIEKKGQSISSRFDVQSKYIIGFRNSFIFNTSFTNAKATILHQF